MAKNTLAVERRSSEKRDPGFVKLRRGLLMHLPEMSERAVKLYVWLLLSARWEGFKRGWVEASFEDMAASNGCSTKTVQRALEELENKPYVEVHRATSQHQLTRIKILKFDIEEPTSTVDKSVHSSDVGVDTGADRGADRPSDRSVHTSPSIELSAKDLQASKKYRSKEVKKEGRLDAVRRPFDAELPVAPPPFRGASRLKKKQNLTARLAKAIQVNGNQFKGDLDRDERAVLQAAVNATRYQRKDSTVITDGFACTLIEVYEKHKNGETSPGNLCSKVIDRCLSQQEACKKTGADPSEYYWPPDFQQNRDRLRQEERRLESQA
jgi:hypothetical protein